MDFPKQESRPLESKGLSTTRNEKKRFTLSHIFITFQNTKDKEKIPKVSIEQ